jgi:hypothetical protein
MTALLFAAAVFGQPAARPPLLIHVMPWFVVEGKELGWHWRMNKSSEDVRKSGKVAAHYQPLTGPYDSKDPHILELQVTWMKLAGFDGIVADWYGTQPHFDYPLIHARTQALFQTATRAGLTISVVYEDQTVKHAIREGLIKQQQAPEIALQTGRFLRENWLARPNWLRLRNKPVVFVFGPQHFGAGEWEQFRVGAGDFSLLTLHRSEPYAQGGFDWPVPKYGLEFTRSYPTRSKEWPIRVAVAFPRFRDYYEEGSYAGERHPDIPDESGQTYLQTLNKALQSGSDAVQVATWNDWQEGTQIEPSQEIRFRDLVATQAARRRIDPKFRYRPEDFELPLKLYDLRRRGMPEAKLKPIGEALLSGRTTEARKLLRAIPN